MGVIAWGAMPRSIDKPQLRAWQLSVIVAAMWVLSGIVDELPKPRAYDVNMAFLVEAAIFVMVVQHPDRT